MKPLLTLAAALLIGGCAVVKEKLSPPPPPSEVEQRAYQSRVFDTDEQEMLRIVVATLQDLNYEVERLSPELGVVGGTRRRQRITVTVNARGEHQVVVRATLHSRRGTALNQRQYQQFFAALEKSKFLKANDVD